MNLGWLSKSDGVYRVEVVNVRLVRLCRIAFTTSRASKAGRIFLCGERGCQSRTNSIVRLPNFTKSSDEQVHKTGTARRHHAAIDALKSHPSNHNTKPHAGLR